MYKSIHIQNYRCFEDLKVDNLAQINLFVGKNGSGKSTILETAFLLGRIHEPWLIFSDFVRRSIPISFDDISLHIFRKNGIDEKINIAAQWSDAEETISVERWKSDGHVSYSQNFVQSKGLKMSFSWKNEKWENYLEPGSDAKIITNGPLKAEVIPCWVQFARATGYSLDVVDLLSKAKDENADKSILEQLRLMRPDLDEIYVSKAGSLFYIKCRINGESEPLTVQLIGDGMVRYLEIILKIHAARNGIIIIDEMENGIHHEIHEKFWQVVIAACHRWNVQLFASTHSYEFLEAISCAMKKTESDCPSFMLHRIEWHKGKPGIVSISKERLESVTESLFEVR